MTTDPQVPQTRNDLGACLQAIGAATVILGAVFAAPVALAQPDGGGLFAENCATCHQAQGQGVSGSFPALAGNSFVQGDQKAVAAVLLRGRGGMPNFGEDLSDAEIAAILTYVRSAWGNHASPVDAATVAAVRGAAPTAAGSGR
jgi:cytochrome c6